ncbi:MAG: hypothetical protein ACRDT4_19240 [Micromonosporaceae bacterium]
MSYGNQSRRWTLRAAACGVLAAGLLAATAGTGLAEPAELGTENYRSSGGKIAEGSVYDYAPTIMEDGGIWRMWWCGADPNGKVRGDDILYAVSESLDGPFHVPGGSAKHQIVFEGTGTGSFDDQHVCDPSVVRNDAGIYFMYYGAAKDDGVTSIGVATSSDGLNWTRLNAGQPIITPSNQVSRPNKYGAGQPSVVFKDGQYYLIFTDTTGAGALDNGAGQFAWRSSDPTFQVGVEAFTKDGWEAKTDANSRSFMVANAFSADWQYAPELKSFIVAHHNDAGKSTLTFLDQGNLAAQPYRPVNVDGAWVEGPGIASSPEKHAMVGASGTDGRVPVDLVHSTEGAPDPHNPPRSLGHKGIDLIGEGTGPSPSPSDSASPSTSPSASESPSESPSTQPTPSASETGGGGGLPTTGSKIALAAGLGLALIAAGAAMYVVARRRRTAAAGVDVAE